MGKTKKFGLFKTDHLYGYIYLLFYNNKYMQVESKIENYNALVYPMLTYAIEKSAETRQNQKTKHKIKTVEKKVLLSIQGVILNDQKTDSSRRDASKISSSGRKNKGKGGMKK